MKNQASPREPTKEFFNVKIGTRGSRNEEEPTNTGHHVGQVTKLRNKTLVVLVHSGLEISP